MSIERLNSGTPGSGATVPYNENGVDRRVTLAELAEVLRPLLASLDTVATQHAAPNASGFSVTIAPPVDGQSVFLALTPAAAYAAGTVVLPAPELLVDKQTVYVSTSQAITALTLNANGQTVYGAPTTLAAGGFFRVRYDAALGAWFRTG